MTITELSDKERLLALNYAPGPIRPAMLAIWQLDETLGRIVASTTELIIGQMRLTWWHERLTTLDVRNVPAEPLLQNLAYHVLHHEVTGADLAVLIEGWEALLEPPPLGEEDLAVFADKRGGTLFRLSAKLLGKQADEGCGDGWALVDFATHCSDAGTASRAMAMARERLDRQGSKSAKPLRILTRLASARARRPDGEIGNPLPRFVFLRAVLG
jgi:phytoene synthase